MTETPRNEIGRMIVQAPPSDREQIRARLREKLERWCDHTNEGVEHNERTAMNNWARAMGAAGGDVEIKIALLVTSELGVGSMQEAKRLIQMALSVADVDEDSAVSMMEQHVRSWYAARNKRLMIVADTDEVGVAGHILPITGAPHANGTT